MTTTTTTTPTVAPLPTPRPGNLQWFGFAKEKTPGTPEAVPTIFIPVTSPKWTLNPTPLVDDDLRGMMGSHFSFQQGSRHDTLTFQTFLYPDNVFPILKALTGGPDTMSGSAAPYLHKISLYNGNGDAGQPDTFTGFLYQVDGKCSVSSNMVCSEVKIDFKVDVLPTLNVTFEAKPATYVAAPTNTPTVSQPFPPWTTAIILGGVRLSRYSDLSLDWKRNVKPVPVLNGSQSPLIYGGEVTVTGQMTGVYQGTSDVDLANLVNNVQPPLVVTTGPVKNGAADPANLLTIQHSKVAYTKADPVGSNNSWMTIQPNIEALMNPTDALDGKESMMQATLTSPVSTAY